MIGIGKAKSLSIWRMDNQFFLGQKTHKWIKANLKDILDLFQKASQLTKIEFEASFGLIGTDMLELPKLTLD